MEQFGHLLCVRINPCQIGAFMKIAINAGQGKIFWSVGTTMLLRHNMLNMQERKR